MKQDIVGDQPSSSVSNEFGFLVPDLAYRIPGVGGGTGTTPGVGGGTGTTARPGVGGGTGTTEPPTLAFRAMELVNTNSAKPQEIDHLFM